MILLKFIGGFVAMFLGLRYWLSPRGVRNGSILSGMLWVLLIELYLILIPSVAKQFAGAEILLPTRTQVMLYPATLWICVILFAALAVFCFMKDRYFRSKILETALDLFWVCNIVLLYYALHSSPGRPVTVQLMSRPASPFAAP